MNRTVLIVDDSPVIIASLTETLKTNGFAVETSSDGDEALQKVKSGVKPDLIITDLNMPKMNGIDLIKKVRPLLRFTPILLLTTESEAAKRQEAKKAGATGWIVKPSQGEELMAVIKQVLPE